MILNMLALVLGLTCFLGCADRLRLINWGTTKPLYVGAYLMFTLWSLWICDRALKSDVEWYQLIGVVAALFWLGATRTKWRSGPPVDVTRPAGLDDGPIRRLFR